MEGMTTKQIELARHALGLSQFRKKSYRNRFIAGDGHPDFPEWMKMVIDRNAKRSQSRMFGGDSMFMLTLVGARTALNAGEQLDKEDFPDA